MISGPLVSWSILWFTLENRVALINALESVNGVAFSISSDEQLQYKQGCYFPMQAMLP